MCDLNFFPKLPFFKNRVKIISELADAYKVVSNFLDFLATYSTDSELKESKIGIVSTSAMPPELFTRDCLTTARKFVF